jgi:uncharacterized damage-inducible protein DinB
LLLILQHLFQKMNTLVHYPTTNEPFFMKEQLVNAWHTHNRHCRLLIEHTSDAAMEISLSKKGGRTVYAQLLHTLQVRMSWLEVVAKDIAGQYGIPTKESPFQRKQLIQAFTDTEAAIKAFIEQSWENGGKVKGFKTGLVPFISYLIAHEAHHRGNMLLTLKQSGIKLADKLKWDLWKWS